MPMLTAEIASTTEKPSMIFARNRKVGSFADTDGGQIPFNPTSFPRFSFAKQPNQGARAPDSAGS